MMTHFPPATSELLNALDEIADARRHLDLVEIVTRHSSEDEGKAMNAVLWTALNKIEDAQAKLHGMLAAMRQEKAPKVAA